MPEWLTGGVLAPYFAVRALIEEGGPYVFWIFVSMVVMWTLVIERYWFFSRVLPGQAEAMLQTWRARPEHLSWCAQSIRQAMISRLNQAMTSRLQLLRVLVPLAPLIGLVGTVTGMLEVFESMALRGSADARTMADGVSHAMICTLTGLAVSISGLYPAYYFDTRSRRQTELYNDQFEF